MSLYRAELKVKQFSDKRCGIQQKCRLDDEHNFHDAGVICPFLVLYITVFVVKNRITGESLCGLRILDKLHRLVSKKCISSTLHNTVHVVNKISHTYNKHPSHDSWHLSFNLLLKFKIACF